MSEEGYQDNYSYPSFFIQLFRRIAYVDKEDGLDRDKCSSILNI
ncbi:hypothetical protein SAMN05216179_1835 [Gracilibacillus kekensis]|uniref:Uncharacterized protein n=1 Tax=Gracilibacillus kekensis TaxID=1027249 RepID=A0A1M7NYA8_9BACI|nr:hypothetical protein SAMN05216179_1835 [Gracilibacillus kekensis]